MASSRIFIRGLPPSISEDEFRKHFSAKFSITDAKLIPHRRIGYVGYKTPEEAAKSATYFNRSFIRMSKIGVEIARPISDVTLPISRKAQREHAKDVQRIERETKTAIVSSSISLKRKHSDVDDSDPKLREFLEVMQPKSKTNEWITQPDQNQFPQEPPRKIQAIEIPEADSDGEYEMVPKKIEPVFVRPQPQSPGQAVTVCHSIPALIEAEGDRHNLSDDAKPGLGLKTTDDDWLRSRTSRLLDLVDHDEIPGPIIVGEVAPKSAPTAKDVLLDVDLQAEPEINRSAVIMNVEVDDDEALDPVIDAIRANGRLFVRNLPYSASEEDLRRHFEPYGVLEEVHLALDTAGTSKGFVLVQYQDPLSAVDAYHNVDGEPFQGRLLHVLPAASKRENKLDEFSIAKLPLKKQKQIKKKAEASTTAFNWNSLYMNQDAVNSSIAERLGISKSELLDPTSADAGVKQAIAETSIIQETKLYFANNGVDLNAFKRQERGDTTILVKNFPFGMSMAELRKMFEEFGQVLRVLMPPTGTIAIAQFAQAPQARAAFANLAYRRIKESVLFLEKAPKDLFTHLDSDEVTAETNSKKIGVVNAKVSTADLLERESEQTSGDTSTLFVRNLNFKTTSARLTECFRPLDGFLSARVNTKTDPKKPGQVLSMGFGFLEFRSKAQAQAALIAMDGYSLDDHKLLIKASHKGLDAAEERKKTDMAKRLAGKRTKIIVKNLPFEASKKDVRALFGTYGQLRSVRMPKKFDNSTRGFAFADFVTAREAENALEALKDTHLLGRRLVLEFAAEDALDAEEEIEKMQNKVGRQVSKIALQKLTGGGRKKFNIGENENEDD